MLLALLQVATAAPNMSLHVQLDSQALKHDDFGLFPTDNSRITSPGLRLGVELNPRLGIQADWHHARTGGMVWSSEEDDYNVDTSAKLVYASDQFDLGVRVEPFTWEVIQPYATVQGSFAMGRWHMDADQNDDSELTELHRRAPAFGGLAVGGAELVVGKPEWALRPSAFLEMGYALRTPHSFDQVGELRSGGYLVRAGTGLRF